LENKIKIKWYKTIESTPSTINILGPQTKFKLNASWVEKSKDKKIGAATVVGRGIKNISLESILNKSAKIWKAPLRPMIDGPILRCANANILRSVKTINKTVNTQVKASSKANSWIVFKKDIYKIKLIVQKVKSKKRCWLVTFLKHYWLLMIRNNVVVITHYLGKF